MRLHSGRTSNGATCDRKNSNGGRGFSFSSFFLSASGSLRIWSRSSSVDESWAKAPGDSRGRAGRAGRTKLAVGSAVCSREVHLLSSYRRGDAALRIWSNSFVDKRV